MVECICWGFDINFFGIYWRKLQGYHSQANWYKLVGCENIHYHPAMSWWDDTLNCNLFITEVIDLCMTPVPVLHFL